MAIPLGKLGILVGAGILGSVLAKEGRASNVSDFISGTFKIVIRQIKREDSTSSVTKPRNDTLLAQVNSLRQELQILASNTPITIMTANTTGGASRYGVIVFVVVVGSGYVWWKGWKLPDMMFATRRSLSDACNSIAKQLESVYSSISVTKRDLSSRIDRVDASLDECARITADTENKVSELNVSSKTMNYNVKNVREVVQTLETKINRIEGKQDFLNRGVKSLCDYALSLGSGGNRESTEALPSSSSRPSLELPPVTPTSRSVSLPHVLPLEPPSPSTSNGSLKAQLSVESSPSPSGVQRGSGISDLVYASSSPDATSQTGASEETKNGSSSSGFFGFRLPGRGASFLTRTRSATNALPHQLLSNRQQS